MTKANSSQIDWIPFSLKPLFFIELFELFILQSTIINTWKIILKMKMNFIVL